MGCRLSRTRDCDEVSGASKKGPANINAADPLGGPPACQDLVQVRLALAAVGALEGVEHATFEGAKKSIQKSELVVFCETQQ